VVEYTEIQRRILPDPESDNCIGVRAACELRIHSVNYGWIIQPIASPGLWGIEVIGTEGDARYLDEVYQDEEMILLDMLAELGAKPQSPLGQVIRPRRSA
jgi:hypothetical protein